MMHIRYCQTKFCVVRTYYVYPNDDKEECPLCKKAGCAWEAEHE